MTPNQPTQIDHLVVAATDLAAGETWCQATLGVVPGPGGEHALFGTHNRLLKLESAGAPNAYLEIIATNPQATPSREAPLKRWFDLDDPALQNRLRQQGPQLVHWVVSVPNLATALAAWHTLGIERGPALTASRDTPAGRLQWQLSVRDDGQRLFDGCLPTLIQWGATHPASTMPPSGVHLNRLTVVHPEPDQLAAAFAAIGLHGIGANQGAAALQAELATPQGLTTLRSQPTETPT